MEKSSSLSPSLDRKSSIEREPRTINIDFARIINHIFEPGLNIERGRHRYTKQEEQAIFVVNTMTVEEALTIFTKGLQPVTCCERVESSDMTNMDEEINCLPSSPTIFEMRKIASAPF